MRGSQRFAETLAAQRLLGEAVNSSKKGWTMTTNLSPAERIIRIILGVVMIAGAIIYPEVPYSPIGWIGVFPLVTGVLGWCPLFHLLGISTAQQNVEEVAQENAQEIGQQKRTPSGIQRNDQQDEQLDIRLDE